MRPSAGSGAACGVKKTAATVPPRCPNLPEPQNSRGAAGLPLPQTTVAIVSHSDGVSALRKPGTARDDTVKLQSVTVCWITLGDRIRYPKNFSLYFCLDRPQYLVVLTDHSLDAMSEMR